MTIKPDEIAFEVHEEEVRTGMNTITRRTLHPLNDAPDDHSDIITALHALIDKRRCIQITHLLREFGLEDGDTITLERILQETPENVKTDRAPDFTAEDFERELKLTHFDPSDLAIGTIVEVTRIETNEGGPGELKRGIVRDTHAATRNRGSRAEIDWGNGTWSMLEGRETENGSRQSIYSVLLGRSNMMGQVHDVQILSPDAVTDSNLLEVRERILEAAEIKEEAGEYEVAEKKSWRSNTGESERGSDLHARVAVSGPALSNPVTVHCRNVWDFGWTATVEDDSLDKKTTQIIKAAARENSPIPTGTRL